MTPAERLRKHQRALEKTQRELDRERVKLENQEKKLVQDIKKSAKNGQIGACKIQAKDLVRTRRYMPPAILAYSYLPRAQVHCQILPDENPITSHFTTDTGKQVPSVVVPQSLTDFPADREEQRADDAVNEGRHPATW